jgi:hypothetical protein
MRAEAGGGIFPAGSDFTNGLKKFAAVDLHLGCRWNVAPSLAATPSVVRDFPKKMAAIAQSN